MPGGTENAFEAGNDRTRRARSVDEYVTSFVLAFLTKGRTYTKHCRDKRSVEFRVLSRDSQDGITQGVVGDFGTCGSDGLPMLPAGCDGVDCDPAIFESGEYASGHVRWRVVQRITPSHGIESCKQGYVTVWSVPPSEHEVRKGRRMAID